jgi:hypothetical protein
VSPTGAVDITGSTKLSTSASPEAGWLPVGDPLAERWKAECRRLQAGSNGKACTCRSPSPGLARIFLICSGVRAQRS